MAAFLSLLLLSPYAVAQQQPDPELRELLRRTVNESSSFIDRFDAEVWLVDMSAVCNAIFPIRNSAFTSSS